MKRLLLVLAILFGASQANAQLARIQSGNTVPAGCSPQQLFVDLDDNLLYFCDGGTFVSAAGAGGAGDIEGVTAGDGLTGGGTSGTVTLNAVGTSPITVAANAVECATCAVTGTTLTAGVGLSGGGDLSANRTFALDLAELVNNQTLWDASQATRTLTMSLSGATDPVLTFGDNSISSNVPITADVVGNVTGNVSGSSGSTTGNAATATALAANPANCAADEAAGGITAAGVAEGCLPLLDLTGFTLGSIPFSDGDTLLEDNANFFWENAANRLHLGERSGFSTLIQDTYIAGAEHTAGNLNGLTATVFTPFLGTVQDNTTNSGTGLYGVSQASHTSGTKGSMTGVAGETHITGAGGTTTQAFGISGYAECVAGTCTGLYGQSTSVGVTGGTVTTAAGIFVGAAVVSSGTATNNVGIDVEAQTATATNAYGLRIGAISGGGTLNDSISVGAGRLNFGSATSMLLPNAAGAGPTVSGHIAYDTTANALEYGDNGTNRTVANLDEAQTLTSKTLDGGTSTTTHAAGANFLQTQEHATDCTAITDGLRGELCIERDSEDLYSCQPTSGGCDSAGEWIKVGDDGGSVSGYATVDEENTPLTQRTTLNFVGVDVTAADDTDQTTVTIAPVDEAYDATGWNGDAGGAQKDDIRDKLEAMPQTAGDCITLTGTDLDVDSGCRYSTIGITIDGGGSAITTGVKGFVEVVFACTIDRATLLADQSGSIVVDVWKDTYANYPPTVADTITASAKPTISTAVKSQDATLTGWTVSVSAGDIIGFNVDSATTITRAHLSLRCLKA